MFFNTNTKRTTVLNSVKRLKKHYPCVYKVTAILTRNYFKETSQ